MKCSNCGAENNAEAKFCKGCGSPLVNEENSNNEPVAVLEETPIQNAELNTTVEATPIAENGDTEPSTNNQNVEVNPTVMQTQPAKKKMDLKNIKKFIPIVVAIVIIVIGFFLVKNLFRSKSTSISDLFNPNTPILVEKNGKYGYINTKGKFVIDAKYEYATSFYGNHAIVNGVAVEEGKEIEVYQVIDTKGKVKASSPYKEAIKYIADENVWVINSQLYDSNLKKKTKEGIVVSYVDEGFLTWYDESSKKAGIMNTDGKITYTYKFANGEDYLSIDPSETDESLKEKYCRVNVENEKYAIVNCQNGKVIYDFTTNYISTHDDNIFEITTTSPYSRIEILYLQNDKLAYQSTSSDIYLDYEPGYLQIRDNSKDYSNRYSYLETSTGKIVSNRPNSDTSIPSEWESTTGLTKFSCDKGKGLMKGDKVYLACEWSDLDFFSPLLYQYLKKEGKDYILATKDSKVHLVNLKNGQTVTEFNTSYISDYDLSTFLTYTDRDTDKRVVYNLLTGKTISVEKSNSISTYSNYIKVKDGSKITYYNTDLKAIYTTEEK